MLLVRTYISASQIHGLGVFADEFIHAGTLIWKFNPNFAVILGPQDIDAMPVHQREFVYKYSFPHLVIGNGVRVLEVDDGKFMNHSYTPNTDFTDFERGFTIRDIYPGEEITTNYHEFDPGFRDEFINITPMAPATIYASHV